MSFLFSSPWRSDALSLFSSINPAYGLPTPTDCSQETQSEEESGDLDDQIFGRNAYSPTCPSLGDAMDSPLSDSSSSLSSPSSFLMCSPQTEPEPFWLAGIDTIDTTSSLEDSYLNQETPCVFSTHTYKIESLFEDEGDRGIHVLDAFSRESSLEVPLAHLTESALFNTHKASPYYLHVPSPPSPLSSISSSLPSPASSPESFSARSELPSPVCSGIDPPLSRSWKSEHSSPVSPVVHSLLLSGQPEYSSSLFPTDIHPLSPSDRLPSAPPCQASSATTNQLRRLRVQAHASSVSFPIFPRIQPYAGELPEGPEPPVRGKVMNDLERRTIVTVLLATKTFKEWDFADRGLPSLEKEAVSTPKARKCGEDRRNQDTRNEIRCLIPGCGANLTALHNFKSHISSHYGVRDWVCDVCSSSFSHSGSLARHKKEFCTAGGGPSLSHKRHSRRKNETLNSLAM